MNPFIWEQEIIFLNDYFYNVLEMNFLPILRYEVANLFSTSGLLFIWYLNPICNHCLLLQIY